jgi:hypothetical protein
MATITETQAIQILSRAETEPTILIESKIATVASSDTVVLNNLPPHFGHWFLSVVMVGDGGAQVAASAGTFAVTVRTWCNGLNESPAVSVIDATTPVTIDWAGPTTGVTVTPSGLADVTTWTVRLAAVRS